MTQMFDYDFNLSKGAGYEEYLNLGELRSLHAELDHSLREDICQESGRRYFDSTDTAIEYSIATIAKMRGHGNQALVGVCDVRTLAQQRIPAGYQDPKALTAITSHPIKALPDASEPQAASPASALKAAGD